MPEPLPSSGAQGSATKSIADDELFEIPGTDTYRYLPGACPGCGTTEGGAYGVVLAGAQASGVPLVLFTALCRVCFDATEAEDFRPTQRTLERVLALIDKAQKGLEA